MSHTKNTFEALLMGAYQLTKQGRLDLALQTINKLKDDWPPHPKLFQLEALVLKSQGNNHLAIECLLKSLDLDPSSSEVHNTLGNVYRDCHNWVKSIFHYQAAIQRQPGYLEASRNLALCYQEQGRAELARQTFNKVLSQKPDDVSSLVALANLERDNFNYDLAEENYTKALAFKSDYFNAEFNRAINSQLAGRKQLAKDCFERAYRIQPTNENLAISMAKMELEEGRTDLAKQRLQQLLAIKPDSVVLHKELDRLFWESGNVEKVGETLRDAVIQRPKNIELAKAYAEQLLLSNNTDEALFVSKQNLKNFGPHANGFYSRAKCYAMQGNSTLAIDDFKRGLAEQHNNDIANDLVQLLLIQGDLDDAQSLIDANIQYNNQCQLSWAMQGLIWREKKDERYQWLHQYDTLIKSYRLNVPNGYQDLGDYLLDLKEVLISLHHSTSAPLDQTLRNGTQTSPQLFSRPIPQIQTFKRLCSEVVNEYLAGLIVDERHPFLNRLKPNFRFAASWSVRLYDQGFHVNHVHPQGWISSSTYISVPSLNSASDEGCITFGESSFMLSKNNKVEKIIRPENGLVVMFPSYTWHGTIPFTSNSKQIRLTAPFDIEPDYQ